MKVLAQSKVADKMQYTHLGYLAACETMANPYFLGAGFFIILITIIYTAINNKKLKSKEISRNIKRSKLIQFILLITILICIILAIKNPVETGKYHPLTYKIRMKITSEYISGYKQSKQKLPCKDSWCDQLILWDEDFEKTLTFASKKYKKSKDDKLCVWAINENIYGLETIPEDMVLLFEAKPGWNTYGGKEKLIPKEEGKDNIIAFYNGTVKALKYEEAMKLNWDGNQ